MCVCMCIIYIYNLNYILYLIIYRRRDEENEEQENKDRRTSGATQPPSQSLSKKERKVYRNKDKNTHSTLGQEDFERGRSCHLC